jgi:hypothetical protein
MDCPECGTPLVTYRLADREAPVCEACGHVGIEAEHHPARARVESWADALGRFYGSDAADSDLTVPVRAADWENPSPRTRAETWTEALERFYGGETNGASGTEGASGEEATVVDSEAEEGDGPNEPNGPSEANASTETDARETPTAVSFEGTPAVRRTESE